MPFWEELLGARALAVRSQDPDAAIPKKQFINLPT